MADNTIANAIKFLKGEEKSLPTTKTEGQVYFAYKNVGTAEKPSYTGAIYIDTPIGGTQNRVKMTANADIADKAFNDSAGLSIRETYLSSLGYTDDGKQTILIKGSGNNQTRIALPIASTTKSGIVTTDAQNFGGTKTFTTINSTNLTITGPDGFNYSSIGSGTADAVRPVWFADNSGNGKPVVNTNFTYNPATQTLSVANLSGTADKANKDNAGNDIRSTYIDNITVNGTTLTFTKGSGATSSITLQDTNNAVTQTAIKSSDYTNWRTVLWGASNSGVEGFTPTTVTDSVFTSDTLTFQPSSGTLRAKVFKGSLSGNASTATTASKAINDGSNQNIANTYVKYKSIKFSAAADKVYLLEGNGAGSVTATSGSNISTAIIPAATDKAAGVITATAQTFSGDKTFNNSIIVNDCLVSKTITGTDKSRFIILPRVPYSMIDSTHDTSTYFKALLKWICTNYPNKKGYSFIGLANPNVESNALIHIYDTGAINKEGYPEYSTGLFKDLGGRLCTFGTVSYNYYCRDTLMTDNNYAGSASPNGAATSANKLNTNAGSTARPIYFSNGIPVQCDDTLANNITGSAYRLFIGPPEDKKAGGLYMFQKNGDTNFCPSDNWWSILRTQHPGYDNGYWQEMAYSFHDDRICFRRNINGSKTSWRDIAFTDSNITGKSASTDAINWVAGNEIRFTKPNYTSPQALHFGWAWADSSKTKLISEYRFDGGDGNLTQVAASQFNGSLNGNANTATALTSSAGSSTQPIYFSGGKPVACTYTLNKSVPADAKFTDTNTWRGIQDNLISTSTSDSLSANQGRVLKGLIDGKAASNHGHNIIGLPRVTKDANTTAQRNTFKVEEFSNGTNYNLPSNAWYHIFTSQGDDTNYATQLALGMTTTDIAYRIRNGSATAWNGWNTIIHSGNYTSYTVTKIGTGASGTWGINVSGNAATAAKLQTARTISLTGSVTGSGTFDGSGNLSITTSTNHSHSQYLPLAGGTMTGTINFTTNKLACRFGGSTSSYYSGVMHQNFGTEAVVFAATNTLTSFIFKCGQSPISMANNTWANITPSMQIKKQSVYINSLIANGVTPDYNLYVNGSTCCHGTLGVGSGSGSAEIDFFPSSSSTIGARIKAYSDRIEFVFS